MPFTYSSAQINKSQNAVVRSSNRFTIKRGDTVIGLLQDLRCQDDYSPEPASGIGDIHVKEYVPTMARHTISTSQACMFTASLRKLGISFENGDDAMKGLVFNIEICDRVYQETVSLGKTGPGNTAWVGVAEEGATGTVLRRYEKCSFASGDIEIRKHAMIVTSATINACNATTPAGKGKSEI
jgi:hypothetical protein